MGKNNKARRAAKAKSRAKARSQRASRAPWSEVFPESGWDGESGSGPWAGGEPFIDCTQEAHELLLTTAIAHRRGDPSAQAGLGRLEALPAAAVNRSAEAVMLDQIEAIWEGGWQPAELHRQGRLGCANGSGARLVGLAMASDHAVRRSTTLDRRWVDQVEGLGLPAVDGRRGWVRRWSEDEHLERAEAVAILVDVIANLLHLPRLDPILPPPGAGADWSSGTGPASAEIDPVLMRIRGLLAKAESSTYEAEAMAFTAKAQELMTRHAIDSALLHSKSGRRDEQPVIIRVPIDAPYADAKSLLLQTVAEAGRCRSIFHSGLALSTVAGFHADVSAVEVLFTSLLLQAQAALSDAAKSAPAGTRTRSQRYRSAFLLAYTVRIGDRLNEINDAVFAQVEAEQGSSFLPVLRSREGEVDDFMAERFGEMTHSRVRGGYDAAGWAGGRIAADNAQLGSGHITEQTEAEA
jgi:hypothetical protein